MCAPLGRLVRLARPGRRARAKASAGPQPIACEKCSFGGIRLLLLRAKPAITEKAPQRPDKLCRPGTTGSTHGTRCHAHGSKPERSPRLAAPQRCWRLTTTQPERASPGELGTLLIVGGTGAAPPAWGTFPQPGGSRSVAVADLPAKYRRGAPRAKQRTSKGSPPAEPPNAANTKRGGDVAALCCTTLMGRPNQLLRLTQHGGPC